MFGLPAEREGVNSQRERLLTYDGSGPSGPITRCRLPNANGYSGTSNAGAEECHVSTRSTSPPSESTGKRDHWCATCGELWATLLDGTPWS